MKTLFQSLVILILVLRSAGAQTLPPANGSTAPNVTPTTFAAAVTEIFQYGPGVWSTPGLASPTGSYFYGRLSGSLVGNPALPVTVPCCIPAPFLGVAPIPQKGFVLVNDPKDLMNPSTAFFGPAIGIFGSGTTSYLSSLAGVFSPTPPPTPLPFNVLMPLSSATVPNTNLVQMGFFSSSAMTNPTATGSYLWTEDFISRLYTQMTTAQMSLSQQSRGYFLIKQITNTMDNYYTAGATGTVLTDQDYYLRQILARDNHQVASFRAVGLNPMWPTGEAAPGGIPVIPTTTFPNLGQLPDYIVNLQAKYYFQESYKHLDAQANLDPLGLLYQVYGDSLAYESGWVNTRYPILDPSCRSPQPTGGCNPFLSSDVTTYMPNWISQFQPFTYRVSFGTASDFAIVYSVLKYFIPGNAPSAAAAAAQIASGNFSSLLSAVPGYPTNLASTVALAGTLFTNAIAKFQLVTQEGNPSLPQSILLAPRPSAAFIAAAAVAGKKVDPVFWGTLAEAEQLVMKDALAKNNPPEYINWAKSLWAPAPGTTLSQMVADDFGLSLTDFGSFRTAPVAGTAPQSYAATPWGPNGLQKLLAAALDPQGHFALVRGPAGLMALDAENISLSENYLNLSSLPLPNPNYLSPNTPLTPYPNGFLEVAATGREIIDGRLLFKTNGSYSVFDFDYSTTQPTPKYLLKFENEVVTGYSNGAAALWKTATTGTVSSLSAASQALPGSSNANAWSAANVYGLLKGSYQPVVVNLSDSRSYQPALQFWLVIAEKLGNTGGALSATYIPPQISSINFGTATARANYSLMNVQSVTPTTGAAPVYDLLTTDSNQGALPTQTSPFSNNNAWAGNVGNLFSQTVHFPFATTTNTYLYPVLAAAGVGGMWPLDAMTATGTLTTPPPVASGAGSIPGHVLQFFRQPPGYGIDPLVKSP